MEEKTKQKLKKARDVVAGIEYDFAVGMTRFNNIYKIVAFTALSGLLITQINSVFSREIIDLKYGIILAPILMILIIVFGKIDLRYIHLTQKINEIALKYHPSLVRLIKNKNENED